MRRTDTKVFDYRHIWMPTGFGIQPAVNTCYESCLVCERVEIVAGRYQGSRGYIEGLDDVRLELIIRLYFQASIAKPSFGLQLSECRANGITITA